MRHNTREERSILMVTVSGNEMNTFQNLKKAVLFSLTTLSAHLFQAIEKKENGMGKK